MKKIELVEKIKKAGGKIKIDNLEITYAGGDIDFNIDDTMIAWIPSSLEDECEASEVISVIKGLKRINYFIKIAQFLEVEVGEIKPIITEKIVTQVSTEEFVLSGKVEAYEKILFNKKITIE